MLAVPIHEQMRWSIRLLSRLEFNVDLVDWPTVHQVKR